MSSLGVCLMGMGIVFAGLLVIIGLCKLVGYFCNLTQTKSDNVASTVSVSPAKKEIPNREELVAALSAVVAEDLGTDVSAIRIISLKRI